mmetsp:Transcript_107606/g.169872  ORF Transcript_107606/g.169872 Transcript_107606/m.169872 type:complete len:83 (+) Transcript_107606:1155-1403(+)
MNFVNAIRVSSFSWDLIQARRDCGLKDCKMSCNFDNALNVLSGNSEEESEVVMGGRANRFVLGILGSKRCLPEQLAGSRGCE